MCIVYECVVHEPTGIQRANGLATYACCWIETGDCEPRGSASRSDTIVIGKPISSTRNIFALARAIPFPELH